MRSCLLVKLLVHVLWIMCSVIAAELMRIYCKTVAAALQLSTPHVLCFVARRDASVAAALPLPFMWCSHDRPRRGPSPFLCASTSMPLLCHDNLFTASCRSGTARAIASTASTSRRAARTPTARACSCTTRSRAPATVPSSWGSRRSRTRPRCRRSKVRAQLGAGTRPRSLCHRLKALRPRAWAGARVCGVACVSELACRRARRAAHLPRSRVRARAQLVCPGHLRTSASH